MARGSRRGAARWPLVALAVVLVGGGIGAAVLGGGDGDGDGAAIGGPGREVTEPAPDAPSRRVEGAIAPIGDPPAEYEITYLVEGYAEGGVVLDVERRVVRLPFESRVEGASADAPDDVQFLQIAGFGVLQSSVSAALASEPSIAPGSAHVAADVVADALEWRHEVREVLDRECQVVRAGGPIDVADQPAPTGEDWADLCVHEDGLVLQEEWYVGGDIFRRRTAIELDVAPSIDDDELTPTAAIPEGVPGGTFVEVTPDSRPAEATHWELPEAPAGFELVGRYAFSPPRTDDQLSQFEVPRVAMILDVYEDGDGGAVVVANGGTADRSALFESGDAEETVDLTSMGLAVGDVLHGLRQAEVRVGLAGGRFLRVYGSLAADELVELARTLRPVDGPGEVTPID